MRLIYNCYSNIQSLIKSAMDARVSDTNQHIQKWSETDLYSPQKARAK